MTKPDPSTDGSQTQAGSNGLIALPLKLPHHPVVLEEQKQRAGDIQLRIADWITTFAGSMNFVYLHVALFTVWMLFIESKPWPTLTLVVSLEAIFLSMFVILHHRADLLPVGPGRVTDVPLCPTQQRDLLQGHAVVGQH